MKGVAEHGWRQVGVSEHAGVCLCACVCVRVFVGIAFGSKGIARNGAVSTWGAQGLQGAAEEDQQNKEGIRQRQCI